LGSLLPQTCGLRHPTRSFSVPAARLGLAYPQDAMIDIVSSAGPQMARYLTYSGARIDAEAALACGFLLEIAQPDRFDARVNENRPSDRRQRAVVDQGVQAGHRGRLERRCWYGVVRRHRRRPHLCKQRLCGRPDSLPRQRQPQFKGV
jgi:hypothetical protein